MYLRQSYYSLLNIFNRILNARTFDIIIRWLASFTIQFSKLFLQISTLLVKTGNFLF